MRFLLVALLALSLSACGPSAISFIDAGPEPDAELVGDQGAVLVEVVHAIGANGPQLDRWTTVKVVSTIEPKKGEKPTIYSLERVLSLAPDSAIFAGVLPSGFYRLATFEGEWQSSFRMRPYGVVLPEKATEFFVSAGKLNSLGVMLQSSLADWTWIYHREPKFDMPALVRELRPGLDVLDAPMLIPESLRGKKKEPASRIERAWPTTPMMHARDGRLLRGAQFGRVYVRDVHGEQAEWRSILLDTLQTIMAVQPVAPDDAYALDAAGRLFRFDPSTGESRAVPVDIPPRLVSIGYENDALYAVQERINAAGGVVLQLYRHAGATWSPLGASVTLSHSPHDLLFTPTHLLATTGGNPWVYEDREIMRIDLETGSIERKDTPVQLIRRLDDKLLVGASTPERSPETFYISRDGGKIWRRLPQVTPVGWPALTPSGDIVVPNIRPVDGTHALFIGGTHFDQDPGVRFPSRCLHFSEPTYVNGKLLLFCGERVFQYEGEGRGWRKEALHEFQSSLP